MRTTPSIAIVLALAAGSAAATKPTPWRSGGIGHRIAVAEGVYVVTDAVIEDSRCPVNVMCVWAGRLVLTATVHFRDGAVPVTLTLGAPQAVGANRLVLDRVTPENTGATIAPQNYRFTFTYLQAS